MITKGIKINLKTLVLLVIVIAIFVLPLLYFFVWRLSDQDYQKSIEFVNSLKSNSSTVNDTVGNLRHPTDIDDDIVAELEKLYKTYDKNLMQLSQSVAVRSDVTTKSVFNQHVETFKNYKNSLNSLVQSLKKYRSIPYSCATIDRDLETYTTLSSFNLAAENCEAAIDSAKSAPYKPFNDEFLSDYLTLSSELVEGYRELVVTLISDGNLSSVAARILNTKGDIVAISQNTLDLTPSSNPAETLQELSDTLNSQRRIIFR